MSCLNKFSYFILFIKKIKVYVDDILLKDDVLVVGQWLIYFYARLNMFKNEKNIINSLKWYLFLSSFLILDKNNRFENNFIDKKIKNLQSKIFYSIFIKNLKHKKIKLFAIEKLVCCNFNENIINFFELIFRNKFYTSINLKKND